MQENSLLDLVNLILSDWHSGLTVGELRKRYGVTSLDILSITEADTYGLSPDVITERWALITQEIDSITACQIMGIPLNKSPATQRAFNYLMTKWLEQAFNGEDPDPNYPFEENAKKISQYF
jgi:hypothetical protein